MLCYYGLVKQKLPASHPSDKVQMRSKYYSNTFFAGSFMSAIFFADADK